ncbi:MAG: polymer-forming cytoskeletal protein [Erythrobacter sp.]|uniref:bactofilin family protein n=1 Tax=Erythrobacter sp. TaxID=1042 RepID=UPI0026085D96|nr:polymer-forming cytoskeletal protein [Erythrobacter sp.]MDJ0978436.1 polymer-forming cytoskeletal protein [Erythrobacter sp.]
MVGNSNSTFSVIGSDISIKGDITASADLHIDGTVEGDIKCASLVQGETSNISGAITAETARLSGKVNGSITARELTVLKSAQVDGDVHYDALTIEQGAQVEGRFAPNTQRPAVKKPKETGSSTAPKSPDQTTLQIAN